MALRLAQNKIKVTIEMKRQKVISELNSDETFNEGNLLICQRNSPQRQSIFFLFIYGIFPNCRKADDRFLISYSAIPLEEFIELSPFALRKVFPLFTQIHATSRLHLIFCNDLLRHTHADNFDNGTKNKMALYKNLTVTSL